MSTLDLSDCHAQLKWADQQIEFIEQRVAEFLADEPYEISRGTHEDGFHAALYITPTAEPPKDLAPPIATTLQAQRSSLDYLAVALAKRAGATNLRGTYFPIKETEEGLHEKGARDKIKRIDPQDRDRIHALSPYKHGNNALYALHWLNRTTKHQQLALMGMHAQLQRISGPGRFYGGAFLHPVIRAHEPGLIAVTRPETDCQFQFGLNVTFLEIDGAQPKSPVVPILNEIGDACRAALQKFE